ncbi:MAG TPA: hypothetical protein VJ773_08825 [Gemmatimonadales bacterium]|nr:hypothetical protein [Gemmatimonadales bacterium]
MPRSAALLAALFAAAATPAFAQSASPAAPDTELLRVAVDSGRKEVALVAGPFDIPGGGGEHAHHAHEMEYPVLRFEWPTDGWLRGFRLEVTDGDGRQLDRRLIHHLNVVNFGRRQLFYPAVERTLAIGQETEDIVLPATIGVPITRGTPMGLIVAWHNESPEPVVDVRVTLRIVWSPTNQMPRPVDVLPVYADVIYPIGRNANFDLPPGASTFSADLTMPLAGRIIGAGGHGHDYGRRITFVEVAPEEKTILDLGVTLDGEGRLLEIERKLPGLWGAGTRLAAGATYRLTGTYQNPTGATIPEGAMVHLAMMFAPERLADWPRLDPADPDTRKDLAFLAARGSARTAGEHEHQE